MPTQMTFSELEYAAQKKLTRRDRFLAESKALTPWHELVALIEPHYPKGEAGQPTIALARLLRMCVAHNCFGLSNEGHGKESDVFADAGYRGVDKREEVQRQHPNVRWHVAMMPGKRRALPETTRSGAFWTSSSRSRRVDALCTGQSVDGASTTSGHGYKGVFAPKMGAKTPGGAKNSLQ